MAVSAELLKQLSGYGLTTANIFYHFPDYPHLIQTYLWQEYDIYPQYPTLRKFLTFWNKELEGPIHQVIVAHSCLIKPVELNILKNEYKLN